MRSVEGAEASVILPFPAGEGTGVRLMDVDGAEAVSVIRSNSVSSRSQSALPISNRRRPVSWRSLQARFQPPVILVSSLEDRDRLVIAQERCLLARPRRDSILREVRLPFPRRVFALAAV